MKSGVTDLTYFNLSRLGYEDILPLSANRADFPKALENLPSPVARKVKSNSNSSDKWQLVKALDDKETESQAYAFKSGDDIVIAYRGSQEVKDWIDTDSNYLGMKR